MKHNNLYTRLKYLSISISIVLSILLISCTSAAPSSTQAVTPKGTTGPQYGGILKILLVGAISNLGDPAAPYASNDSTATCPAVENLLRIDDKGALIPWLATGWQVSSDLKSITMTLRKGVKFHDGTDFNAEAVKVNLDRYRASAKPELQMITSVDILDDYTIRLNLSKYDNTILSNFAYTRVGPGLMFSPTALKTQTKDWLLTHPVGTGPFKFVSFQRDVSLKYTKWDGYWQKGKPYLDGVEFLFVGDQTTALMVIKGGEADSALINSPQDAFDIEATGKFTLVKSLAGVFSLIGDSGHANSPFADIRVRRAICYAIDNKAIAEAFGKGLYSAANQPASKENWQYSTLVKGYPYNPQKARELLKESGYVSGLKTSFTYRNLVNPDAPVAIQGYLKAVGIDLTLNSVTMARYTEIIRGGWQDGMVNADIKTPVLLDPSKEMQTVFSAKSVSYVSGMHPSEVEDTIAKTLTETNFDKRKGQFQELFKQVIDDYCLVMPIYVSTQPTLNSLKLKDSQIGNWIGYWIPENAWLSK